MELRSLRVFAEVVRCGSFTAAGARLHLTQPSISRIIRQLEDEIGQSLITRNYRDITLTDAGKILHGRALQMIREMAALEAEIAELVDVKRGIVTLGIPPLGGTLFVPFIKRFKERYPGIELQLVEKGSKATERSLLNSEIEIGTLIMPVDASVYECIQLSEARLVLAARSDSPWAKRTQVDLAELASENLILFPHEFGLNDSILHACRKCGFEPRVVSRSSHSQLILGLVESGVGVSLLPGPVVGKAPGVSIIPVVNPEIEWNISLAWPRRNYLSLAARAMISLAREKGLDP